jgi:hypothetical protein
MAPQRRNSQPPGWLGWLLRCRCGAGGTGVVLRLQRCLVGCVAQEHCVRGLQAPEEGQRKPRPHCAYSSFDPTSLQQRCRGNRCGCTVWPWLPDARDRGWVVENGESEAGVGPWGEAQTVSQVGQFTLLVGCFRALLMTCCFLSSLASILSHLSAAGCSHRGTQPSRRRSRL